MSADLLEAFGSGEILPLKAENKAARPVQNTAEFFPRPTPLVTELRPTKVPDNVQPLWQRDVGGADVLFDACDDEEREMSENEFGDFEDVQSPVPSQHSVEHRPPAHTDLLDLNDDSTTVVGVDHSVKENTAAEHDRYHIFVKQGSQSQIPQNTAHTQARLDDEWGNFEDAEMTEAKTHTDLEKVVEPTLQHSSSPPAQFSSDDDWETFDDGLVGTQTAQPSAVPGPVEVAHHSTKPNQDTLVYDKERPTNIPPPFSLLQLITPAVQSLSVRCQPQLSTQELLILANGIVSVYRTISRLIAGRSHRWKRDAILSQSMRISLASHRTTGMKLTSLDRSETIKEEQEAIEAVSSWTKYSHTLNPVLLRAKIPKPAMSLNANMKSRTVTGPGILNDREACAICGLKRNERVVGIDVKIDDIFEEFWIEHWGHSECRQFWYEFKGLLSHR